jgi:hypothetical protein
VRVVHGLEVVEVAEQDGDTAFGARDTTQLLLEKLQQVAAVGQAGQAVLPGLALEHPAVGLLRLAQGPLGVQLAGEVLELGDDVEQPVFLVPHRGHVDQHRHRGPVAANVRLADLVAVERAVDELAEQGRFCPRSSAWVISATRSRTSSSGG